MLFNCESKLIIIMVGLPARGKSYTAHKILRYFKWIGYTTKIFNVGDMRRNILGGFQNASFFDHNNKIYSDIRDNIAYDVMNKLITWLKEKNNNIGIFDATNSTIKRRKNLYNTCIQNNFTPIFIENICTDKRLITDNLKMKLTSPDYKNISENDAKKDFFLRLNNYAKVYETVNFEEELPFVKIINNNTHTQVININGLLEKEILCFLLHLKINKYPIYLTRHGESQYNTFGKLGGDSSLSEFGKLYKDKLNEYIINENQSNIKIYTSTLKRTIETSEKLSNNYNILNYKILDEINAGICDGMTYDEVKEKYPEIHKKRKEDKFNFRYPIGESYRDIIERIKPFILEIESLEKPILIICHNAICRVIYSYLLNLPQEEIPFFDIPLHTVIKLTPNANSYTEMRYKLL